MILGVQLVHDVHVTGDIKSAVQKVDSVAIFGVHDLIVIYGPLFSVPVFLNDLFIIKNNVALVKCVYQPKQKQGYEDGWKARPKYKVKGFLR